MTRDEFIENYKGLCRLCRIDPMDMPVGAGGSLLMNRMRTLTDDIDTSVTQETYDKIKNSLKSWLYYEDHNHPSGKLVLAIGPFDIHLDVVDKDRIEMIEGVACQCLEDVLELKLRLNREKDKADIENIRKVLRQRSR